MTKAEKIKALKWEIARLVKLVINKETDLIKATALESISLEIELCILRNKLESYQDWLEQLKNPLS